MRDCGDPSPQSPVPNPQSNVINFSSLTKTLRFRLMLWNAGVVMLMVIITLVGLREGVRYTLIQEADARLVQDLYEIEMDIVELKVSAEKIRIAASGGTAPEASRLLAQLDRKAQGHAQQGWFIELLDTRGRGNEIWTSVNTPRPRPLMPQVDNFQPVTVGNYRLVENRNTSDVFAPVVVRIGVSNEFLNRDMALIDRLVMTVGGIAMIVALVAGYWLTDRATRPLQTIINTTSRLRPRQLDQRLPIRGSGDEIDQLSQTINGLLDRIAIYLGHRRDFLANSAHELRTPVAAIRSTAEVALGGTRTNNEYEELLEEVIEECTTLELLVNQLLLLAETETDRLATHGERANLTQIVERSVDMFEGVAEYHGIALTMNSPPNLYVEGAAHHLRQVLNNLIDNATKFTPRGGRVSVELDAVPNEKEVRLRVRDTGAGIPAADLPYVFERFFRGDRSHSHDASVRGTGLGLSICRAVVLAHGGRIFVESELGRGTTFTVLLPLAGVDEARSRSSDNVPVLSE